MPPEGAPSHHHSASYYGGMPPPPRGYPGYDSRANSWEQMSPNVVENRNSFDSDGSGSRCPPGYYPPPEGAWQHPPHESHYRRGWGPYEVPPSNRGPYPPPPPPSGYYEDYYGTAPPHHLGPSQPPPPYGPYTYVQQTTGDEKTVLRKKFSWKNFPEVCQLFCVNAFDSF